MLFEEMLALERSSGAKRRGHSDEEHRIQCSCIKWFRYRYGKYAPMLFAVPNGGSRDKREAGRLKAEGVRAGVADLILLIARGGYGSLCIEMKTPTGRQSDKQKEWQAQAEMWGNKYVVCRSLADFIKEVENYLSS